MSSWDDDFEEKRQKQVMNFKAKEKDALLKKIASHTSGDVILTDEKEREIARLLYGDSYIMQNRTATESRCSILPAGRVFLECGGHVVEEKRNLRGNRKATRQGFASEVIRGILIGGGGIALGSLLTYLIMRHLGC